MTTRTSPTITAEQKAAALVIVDDLFSSEPIYHYEYEQTHVVYVAMLRRLEDARKVSMNAAQGVLDAIKEGRENSPLAQLLKERQEAERIKSVGILLSDVTPELIHWLWTGRIALKKLHMLDGDPGLGKTLVILDLIARLTTGRPMPGETWAAQKGGAVIISLEDGLADTLQPRLARAGADLEKIVSLAYHADEDDRMFSIETDLDLLEAAIKRVDAKIVLMDPIMALLGGKDTYKDNEVRAELTPLKALAERCDVAIILIRHVNKGGNEKLIYQGGGSIGFIGLSRIGLLVAKNPEDEEQCVFANIKNNLTRTAPKLLYRVVDDAPDDERPYIRWEGVTSMTDSQLATRATTNVPGELRQRILKWLKDHYPNEQTPKQIADGIGEESIEKVTTYLSRMAKDDQIIKAARGMYLAHAPASSHLPYADD